MSREGICHRVVFSRDQNDPHRYPKEVCSGRRERSVQRSCVRSDTGELEEAVQVAETGEEQGQGGQLTTPLQSIVGT